MILSIPEIEALAGVPVPGLPEGTIPSELPDGQLTEVIDELPLEEDEGVPYRYEGPLEVLYAGGPGTITCRRGNYVQQIETSPASPTPIPQGYDVIEITGSPFQLGVRKGPDVHWSEPIDPEEQP